MNRKILKRKRRDQQAANMAAWEYVRRTALWWPVVACKQGIRWSE